MYRHVLTGAILNVHSVIAAMCRHEVVKAQPCQVTLVVMILL